MDRETFDESKAKLEEKLVRAMERVDRLEMALKGLEYAYAEVRESRSSATGSGEAFEAVSEVALTIEGKFGVLEVQKVMELDYPKLKCHKSTVIGVLKDLVNKDELVLVQQGKGRSPSKFKRKDAKDEVLRMAL